MKKRLLRTLFPLSLVFGMGILLIAGSLTSIIKADTGHPVSITAAYDSITGQLNASGSYQWEECEPGEETNILAFALFINGGTPTTNDSNALDEAGMHITNNGNPCTGTPGNWEDNSHTLTSTPTSVCVVVYDVREDDSADPGGTHSTIGAGVNHNIDNSWDRLEDDGSHYSYLEGACTTPVVTTSTPTPTPTPTATPAPTDNNSNNNNDGGDGLGCAVNDCSGNKVGAPQGQVLGASTMAGTGNFAEDAYLAIMTLGGTLSAFGIKNFKKASKKV